MLKVHHSGFRSLSLLRRSVALCSLLVFMIFGGTSFATTVTGVSAGDSHSLYLKSDGTLWGMGYNADGQLGDGTTTSRSLPIQVATNVSSVSAGNSHSLFVKTDGTLWGMG
jgi:alpha-tubulin suppressor-like RCC1 family protein